MAKDALGDSLSKTCALSWTPLVLISMTISFKALSLMAETNVRKAWLNIQLVRLQSYVKLKMYERCQ